VLVKVPGRYSGFLAMDAVRAARNANVCLVPEFAYDLYGPNGLLRYISERVKLKGYCILVYSEGSSYAVRDIKGGLASIQGIEKE
jgi:6-phosphofructokinase 1